MYEIKIFKEIGDEGYTQLTSKTMKEVYELFNEIPVNDFQRILVEKVDKQIKKK